MLAFKSLFVTIKATLKCNLACTYCYGRDNDYVGEEMDDVQIFKAIDFIHEYAKLKNIKIVSLCWHGGEPFLFKPDRLEHLCEYAKKKFATDGIDCIFSAQTNGLLLTKAYYPLIKKYFNAYVGVSLDLGSDFRLLKTGDVSSDLVIKNIDDALAEGIKCGVINLITKQNVNKIDYIYQFYKQRNIDVRLARVFPISDNYDLTEPMYVSDQEFANAMIEYFDLWLNDPKPAKNTDIIKLIGDMLLGRPSICLREKDCQERYLALSPEGNIYPCAEFDTQDSIIGNFLSQTAEEFSKSNVRDSISEQASMPNECYSCKYETTCYGGCLRERFMLKYPFRCKSNVLYWDHVLKYLESKSCALYFLKNKSKDEILKVMSNLFSNK